MAAKLRHYNSLIFNTMDANGLVNGFSFVGLRTDR